ncbi:serine hydrolase domain-containing protein [Bdellovibrio bacteriovorus]|uniref:serine hydrolase domain-containing protein n=1 Tax=Bdellovibrio bacteriovorus TaxID=959 RepID=UPI0035A710EC
MQWGRCLVAFTGIAFLSLIFSVSVFSKEPAPKFPDAVESDPIKMKWMVGSPPPADRIVRFDDGSFFNFPQMRWSVSHFRQLMPTIGVSRGKGPARGMPVSLRRDIDRLTFKPVGQAAEMSWEQSLLENYTDGILILHKGKIVYEKYLGSLTREGQHAAMSMTKSFVGTVAEILVAEGTLDPEKPVVAYVPELQQSGFKDGKVRDLMDMTTAIRFSEDYADPKAEVWQHAKAGDPLPKGPDYKGPRTYFEFLQTIRPEGVTGSEFHYKTANTDALGWVLSRASGKNVAELISEKIWRPLGAEQDAYMTVDSIGTPFAGGGLNLGLRDLARFGELMRNRGRLGGKQVIPEKVVASVQKGGDPEKFKKAGYGHLQGWSYRSMWWVTHNSHGAFMARGVHGQALYVDPKAQVVIARFGSHPIAANSANDAVTLPAFQAVAEHLMKVK